MQSGRLGGQGLVKLRKGFAKFYVVKFILSSYLLFTSDYSHVNDLALGCARVRLFDLTRYSLLHHVVELFLDMWYLANGHPAPSIA